jgi:hypothetical protein
MSKRTVGPAITGTGYDQRAARGFRLFGTSESIHRALASGKYEWMIDRSLGKNSACQFDMLITNSASQMFLRLFLAWRPEARQMMLRKEPAGGAEGFRTTPDTNNSEKPA